MAKTKSNNSSCALLILAVIVLLAIVGVAFYISTILLPSAALSDFGEPQPGLPTFKRMQLSSILLLNRDRILTPMQFAGEDITFTVNPGENAATVAYNLWLKGIILDDEIFVHYLVYKGYDTAIQQGEFTFSPGMTAVDMAQALLRQSIGIVVLPGYRLEEIARIVEANTQITAEQFLQFATQPMVFGLTSRLPIENGLEGLITPMTYPVEDSEITAFELVSTMLETTEMIITPELIAQFEANGLTLTQAITMASMIERENHINIPNEMEQMASVFYNRIANGMLLQSDPTVQYALRNLTGSGEWWPSITQADYTSVDSPYNTYLYTGFPPTPICMVSTEALLAVAYPAQTDYFYFRACPGENFHRFSASHEEHLNQCP
ncbi:MAG: endolytic transglycosylase MltG [Anaerolineae bacterium]|jgi:UPF0755 protein|nr:endolytic transglycosylase MltG [Anaerolineae bacterium]